MVELSTKEIRFRWWEVTVLLFNVIVPLTTSLLILLAPQSVLMDGYKLEIKGHSSEKDDIDDDRLDVNQAFRDVGRIMACGQLMLVLLSYLAATTDKIHILLFSCALIVIYNAMVVGVLTIQWLVGGYMDIVTFLMDLATLILFVIMILRIRFKLDLVETEDERIRLIV